MMDDADTIDPIIPDLLPSRPAIETVAHLRVCERIEAERSTIEAMRFEMPLAERWSALTEPLPLAGRTAMRPDATGGFPALDAVAAAMPWAAGLIADLARGLRLQLALGRPWVQFEPVLLVGPPGVGKSWLTRRALLSMIEPGSAKRWPDPCLLGACDLSAVNWVACANTIDPIPAALRSRFWIVELAPPDPTHFDAALASVLGDLAARWDLPANLNLMPPPRAVRLLRRQFADHRSIRLLARHATAIVGAMIADGAIITRQ